MKVPNLKKQQNLLKTLKINLLYLNKSRLKYLKILGSNLKKQEHLFKTLRFKIL